jgi:hypothetical protein
LKKDSRLQLPFVSIRCHRGFDLIFPRCDDASTFHEFLPMTPAFRIACRLFDVRRVATIVIVVDRLATADQTVKYANEGLKLAMNGGCDRSSLNQRVGACQEGEMGSAAKDAQEQATVPEGASEGSRNREVDCGTAA